MPVIIKQKSKSMNLPTPISTGTAAVYPYDPALEMKFNKFSRFGDEIKLSKVVGEGKSKRLWLPRAACPMGKEDHRTEGLMAKFENHFKPRDERQELAFMQMKTRLLDGQSFIMQAPTGFGKTYVTSAAIAEVGRKTLVVVTKEDIKDQWFEAFRNVLGLPPNRVGLLQGDVIDVVDKPVVIGMVHSLSKPGKYDPDIFRQFGLVVWDEVHRLGADMFSESAWLSPAKLRLGVSATPTRSDGKEVVFKSHIGEVKVVVEKMAVTPKVLRYRTGWKAPVAPRSYKGLLEGKEVIRHKMVQLPEKDGKTIHISKMLARDIERNRLIGRLAGAAYKKGRNTIIFCDTLAHLEELRSVLRQFDVPMSEIGLYVGGLKKAQREIEAKKKVVLSTYSFCSEGTDIPWLDTLILGTPRAEVEQIVGRILRQLEDKREPVVFDLVDDDSEVFTKYAAKRMAWYNKIGAKVSLMG